MANCCTKILNKLFNIDKKGSLKVPVKCCNPDTGSITIHILLFIAGLINFFWFGLKCSKNRNIKILLTSIFLYLVLVQMRAWITCSFTNPGYVIQCVDDKEIQQENDQETLNTCALNNNVQINEVQQDNYDSVMLNNLETNKQINKKQNFCNYCQLKQENGVFHCDQCGHCIYKYDHHCPFLGNCIGQRNYRYFYKFCLYATLSAFYSLVISLSGFLNMMITEAVDAEKSKDGNVVLSPEYEGLKILFLMIGGGGIFIFSFIGACFPFGMCINNIFGIFEEFQDVEKQITFIDPETHQATTKIIIERETLKDYLGPKWCWFLLKP